MNPDLAIMQSAVRDALSRIDFETELPSPDELESINSLINELIEEWSFNGHVIYTEDGICVDSVEIYIDPHTNEIQIEYNP